MSREVRLVREGYGEEALTHLASVEERGYDIMANASMYVPRTDISPGDIDKGVDRAELRVDGEVKFAGIIEDVVRNGDEKELIVEGWERLAESAPFYRETEQWATSDAAIIRDAINDVPELTVGEIETTNPSCSILVEPGVPPSSKARKAAKISPGFLRFNPDKSVDYGDLGSDKTHYTLSPRSDVVTSEFEIEEKGGYDKCTHLLVLGAGEQDHQVQGLGVSDDYNEQEDRAVWRSYRDKSIESKENAKAIANRLVEEMKTALLDVTLTIQGVECGVGDWFRVYLPTEDIDEDLQVVEHKRSIDETGTKHEVTLSNHNESRELPEDSQLKDLDNYNTAIEGAPMSVDGGGSRQPVGYDYRTDEDMNWHTSHDYVGGVVHEHRVELRIEGDAYRAYSSGADAGGGPHSHVVEIDATSTDNADFESTVVSKSEVDSGTITASWDTYGSVTPMANTSSVNAQASFSVSQTGSETDVYTTIDWRLVAYTDSGTVYHPDTEGATLYANEPNNQISTISLTIPQNLNDASVELQARLGNSQPGDWTLSSRVFWQGEGRHTHDVQQGITSTEEVGEHTHGPDPGMTEHFPEAFDGGSSFPSECDVIINGQSLGLSLGNPNQEWTETVDIQGILESGQENSVDITSETPGHIQAWIQGDAVRRIHGRN